MRVERFDSVEAYARHAQKLSYRSYDNYGPGTAARGNSWDAGVGFDKAIKLAKEGDPSLVDRYAKSVDKLVNEYKINEVARKQYISSIAGSRVSVPEYLAGAPRCMKKRAQREISTRSVNIYVGLVCSANIPADCMLKRGCTILALLEFLQSSQVQVDLYLLVETHGTTDGDFIQVINVESHPLDLSTAGFAIAHPAFARQITYAVASSMDGFNGDWGYSRNKSNYKELLSQKIGMGAQDIYVPPPHRNDEEIISNPQNWLEKYIKTIKNSSSTD